MFYHVLTKYVYPVNNFTDVYTLTDVRGDVEYLIELDRNAERIKTTNILTSETFDIGDLNKIPQLKLSKYDFDSYEVKKIMSNGTTSGYLIKIVSENKLVFADKNERTKKVTYFDGDLGGVFVGDFSNENKGDDYTTTAWKFLGFTKKFIGGGKSCGPERDQIGTGCIKNCKKTFSILFMEFSYGDLSVEGC